MNVPESSSTRGVQSPARNLSSDIEVTRCGVAFPPPMAPPFTVAHPVSSTGHLEENGGGVGVGVGIVVGVGVGGVVGVGVGVISRRYAEFVIFLEDSLAQGYIGITRIRTKPDRAKL